MIATGFALVSAIVGAVVGIEARYEKADAAESAHEYLAAENETDRLATQLEIVKIKIGKFIEMERDVILERLSTKG
jgi:hypothetical protein